MPEDFWIITGVFVLVPLAIMAPFIIAADISKSRQGGLREYYFKKNDASDSGLAYIAGIAIVSLSLAAFLSRIFGIFKSSTLLSEILANNPAFNSFLLFSGGILIAFSSWRLGGAGLTRKEIFWILIIWTALFLIEAVSRLSQ